MQFKSKCYLKLYESRKKIDMEILVIRKWLYHAFGTYSLQYIIQVIFNTKSLSVYTVDRIWEEFGIRLHLTKNHFKKKCFTRQVLYSGMKLLFWFASNVQRLIIWRTLRQFTIKIWETNCLGMQVNLCLWQKSIELYKKGQRLIWNESPYVNNTII